MPDPVSRGAARTATLVALPVAALVGVLIFSLLGGFHHGGPKTGATPTAQPSSTVSATAPQLSDRAATVCRAFIAQLPGKIRDRHRRPVSAGAEQNAAYGDPALRVGCGAPRPSFPPTATVYPLSGVCFYASTAAGHSVWTTLDREVPVAITVPDSYSGPGQWVAEFSDAIAGSVPSASHTPIGCS